MHVTQQGPRVDAVEVTTLDGQTTAVDARDVESLRGRLRGAVLRRGDDGFADAVRIWNGMAQSTPALVAQPAGAEDVAEVVRFARERRLLLSVKGGGHNIAGTALAEGALTLDMSRLRTVEVDAAARRVRVGAGCLLRDVDAATQRHGLATVLGFVSDTGVAGLTLGGGLGYLTRRFGWTADNLLEVELVTAQGERVRASRERHADLFWALRGGGGNFGVATEFTYRLHEVGPEITGGVLAWPAETAEQAARVLEAYRRLTSSAPRELSVFCTLRRAPPAPFLPEAWHGRRVALLLVCHTGDAAAAPADLAPLRDALGPPLADLVARRPYAEQQALIDESEPTGMGYYWKTEFLRGLDDGLLAQLAELSQENPVPMAEIGLLHLGGALNERAPDDGAVGNRDARFALGINAMWEPGDAQWVTYQAWVRDAWRRVRPYSSGGNYVNFQTADDGADRIVATYGANLARLAEVKRRYDPENLFRVNRNVPPAPPAA